MAHLLTAIKGDLTNHTLVIDHFEPTNHMHAFYYLPTVRTTISDKKFIARGTIGMIKSEFLGKNEKSFI